jgi:hypothetical protein
MLRQRKALPSAAVGAGSFGRGDRRNSCSKASGMRLYLRGCAPPGYVAPQNAFYGLRFPRTGLCVLAAEAFEGPWEGP